MRAEPRITLRRLMLPFMCRAVAWASARSSAGTAPETPARPFALGGVYWSSDKAGINRLLCR